jgi:hypothetical protein
LKIPTKIAAAMAILLTAVGGYYLGGRQCHVEADAWGYTGSQKVAVSNQYDCEVLARIEKAPRCQPLNFDQVRSESYLLLPRQPSRGPSN